MTEVVLRHPDLPKQPIVVPVGSDGVVSPEWAASGWEIDLDTAPAKALLEKPDPREEADVVPHFAVVAEPAPEVVPTRPRRGTETPAVQPETTEQGDTSLELTKE